MDNTLTITRKTVGQEQQVILAGRLDATWAAHLDEFLTGLVREGSYRIILDMAGIQYLSSAGIRILVNQYKQIKKIGGQLILRNLSEAVAGVLQMVGMLGILTEEVTEAAAPAGEAAALEIHGYRFIREELSEKPMTLTLTGDPGRVAQSGYTSQDSHPIRFRANSYGLGIGAIGAGFDDCRTRYGEFLALGEAVVYKPSDGSRMPDYTLRTGSLEPEINALYALRAEGSFNCRVTFDPVSPGQTIPIGELAAGLEQSSGLDQFIFLMIAESGGLVGVSLNSPPVGGEPMFEFPAVRERVRFTTEPAYARMLAVTIGIYSKNPEGPLSAFLRPVAPGSGARIHAHAAIFPFQALPRQEALAGKLVLHLFETGIVDDLLHLITDSREINGIGSSAFKQGVAWIGKI
ncbi:MAG: STAS domain-containing protein [Bacteroidales bacterium]